MFGALGAGVAGNDDAAMEWLLGGGTVANPPGQTWSTLQVESVRQARFPDIGILGRPWPWRGC